MKRIYVRRRLGFILPRISSAHGLLIAQYYQPAAIIVRTTDRFQCGRTRWGPAVDGLRVPCQILAISRPRIRLWHRSMRCVRSVRRCSSAGLCGSGGHNARINFGFVGFSDLHSFRGKFTEDKEENNEKSITETREFVLLCWIIATFDCKFRR